MLLVLDGLYYDHDECIFKGVPRQCVHEPLHLCAAHTRNPWSSMFMLLSIDIINHQSFVVDVPCQVLMGSLMCIAPQVSTLP